MGTRIRNHLVDQECNSKNTTGMRLRQSWPSRRIGTNQKEIGMSRVLHVTFVLSAFTGLVLAQGPPPAAVNAPGTAPGPGRPGLTPVVIGPPPPVPPEAAIPRPTPAELAQINETVKKWIDSDKSPAKPLLTKF